MRMNSFTGMIDLTQQDGGQNDINTLSHGTYCTYNQTARLSGIEKIMDDI